MHSRLLNENDAAEILGVAPATLRRWRIKGAGPTFVKVGSAVRYKPEVLLQYIDGNVMTFTSAKIRV